MVPGSLKGATADRSDLFWQLLLTLVFLVLYFITTASWPHPYDSAKFQFIGKVLGTPHPTGYPTYILLNFIWVHLLPLGSLAWKVNILSAVLTIAALNFTYRSIVIFDIKKHFAFIAAVILGMTRELWRYSVTAEVYSLHLFFTSLVVYLLLKWHLEKREKYFFLACFFYALSFGNHMTSITLLPAWIYIVIITDWKTFFNIKRISWIILSVFIGVLQYSYLFWRYYDPATRFLEGRTPDLKSFWLFVTGGNWQTEMFVFSTWELLFSRLPRLFHKTMIDFFYLPFLLALIGIFVFKNKRLNIFFLLFIVGNSFFALNYNIVDISSYYLPNYFILTVYLAFGLQFLANRVGGSVKKYRGILITYGIFLFFFAVVNVDYMNRLFLKSNETVPSEVKACLQSVGKDAVIISPGYRYSTVF
jgi:hypothetical protein